MYTSYFGFKENPFSLTPDPNYIYFSRHHQEAFDHLLYGINERKGFVVITGGIGTGKTTLCRALLRTLDPSIKTALVFNAYISDTELLETINQEFGIETPPALASRKGYIDSLNDFLLETYSNGGNAVLLIDEAQNLSPTVLEQIRMLSNLETEKEKLLQIILVGQSELRNLLSAPSLKQLDERIMVRFDLKPLDKEDIRGYVEHRLVVAGGKGGVKFTKGALDAIYEYSQGNPRRINGVCDRALLISYSKDEFNISRQTVQKAIKEIRGTLPIEPAPPVPLHKKPASLYFLLFLLIIAAAFAGWTYREPISAIILPGEKVTVEKAVSASRTASEPKAKGASIYLDDQTSLASLFRLFGEEDSNNTNAADTTHLGLFSFSARPEHYRLFRKPFRLRISGSESPSEAGSDAALPSSESRYLVIRKVTPQGAIAIDTEGKERPVSNEFILKKWTGDVSWVYPYENKNTILLKGMRGNDVLILQQALTDVGYPVEQTGIYGEQTFEQVMKFQNDFRLLTDGVCGIRTRGLLYQISDIAHFS